MLRSHGVKRQFQWYLLATHQSLKPHNAPTTKIYFNLNHSILNISKSYSLTWKVFDAQQTLLIPRGCRTVCRRLTGRDPLQLLLSPILSPDQREWRILLINSPFALSSPVPIIIIIRQIEEEVIRLGINKNVIGQGLVLIGVECVFSYADPSV